jgi:hypothetical protein
VDLARMSEGPAVLRQVEDADKSQDLRNTHARDSRGKIPRRQRRVWKAQKSDAFARRPVSGRCATSQKRRTDE